MATVAAAPVSSDPMNVPATTGGMSTSGGWIGPRPDRHAAVGFNVRAAATEGEDYAGARWTLAPDQSSFRGADLETHVESDDASPAWVVAITSVPPTVPGALAGLITPVR